MLGYRRARISGLSWSSRLCDYSRKLVTAGRALTRSRIRIGNILLDFRYPKKMSSIKVGRLAMIPPGSVVHVESGGGQYAVCNVGGTLHAIDGLCPHAGGPLGHGALHGHFIVCPFHAWAFDCRTGEFEGNALIRLRTFQVRVEGDDVLLDVSPHAGTA